MFENPILWQQYQMQIFYQVWYLRDNCFDHNILARELLDLCLLKASFH